MKKLALINHSFHIKTKSFSFLSKILSQEYDVTEYFDYEWEGGNPVDVETLNSIDYDAIYFAQIYPKREVLKKLKCKNLLWMPMYDGEVHGKLFKYLKIIGFNIKVVSFSRALHKKFKKMCFDSTLLQYYPEPETDNVPKVGEKIKIFYWPRRSPMSWELVKKLLDKRFSYEITIEDVPDPGNEFIYPTKEDETKYSIKYISHWLSHEEFRATLETSDIFIAPRLYEGIGMAFLEAMARSVAVISPNYPTMNEYINDSNGYLFDINNPRELNFSNLYEIKKNSLQSIVVGSNNWNNNKNKIYELIQRNGKESKFTLNQLIGFLYNEIRLILATKKGA